MGWKANKASAAALTTGEILAFFAERVREGPMTKPKNQKLPHVFLLDGSMIQPHFGCCSTFARCGLAMRKQSYTANSIRSFCKAEFRVISRK